MTTIINYNLGNPVSIQNMIRHIGGGEVRISSNLADIASADRLILPGVGNFEHGMKQLHALGLVDSLTEQVLVKKKPILGICLGMQLLTKHSEEGNADGLGFVDATTKKFEFQDPSLKIPHMGWNTVSYQKQSTLTAELTEQMRYYFVHSYYVDCAEPSDILCTTEYGLSFVSGFQHGHIFGLQFHPEKSHKFGMELLANFCKF